MPAACKDDIKLNYAMMEDTSQFRVPEQQKKEHPTAEQVEANKAKWGVTS